MLTLTLIAAVAAFVIACLAPSGRAPLWVAVLLLAALHLLAYLPLR